MKNEIILTNIKSEDLSPDLLKDLRNKKSLVNYGFTASKMYIKRLADNKPATLKTFCENMKENKNILFYFIIELDKEKANARRFYTSKNYIIASFVYDVMRKVEKLYNFNYCGFEQIDYFYRQGDYEEARKCAKNIYCIYTQSEAEQIARKHETRRQLKNNYFVENHARFKKIDIDYIYYRASGSPVYSPAVSKKISKIVALCDLYTKPVNINYYFYGNKNIMCEYLSTDTKSEELKPVLFDKNGYFIFNHLQTLKKRASELKEQREKARVLKSDFFTEINTLTGIKSELIKSLETLNNFLLDELKRKSDINTFYLIHRIEPTINKIEAVNDLIKQAEQKTPASITQFLTKINELKESVKHTLFYNKSYLSLTDEERSERASENAKVYAIYYNYVKENNGVLCLDIEKAEEKRTQRGY